MNLIHITSIYRQKCAHVLDFLLNFLSNQEDLYVQLEIQLFVSPYM